MKKLVALLIGVALFMMFINVFAQEAPKFKYIGASKCKMCHNKAKTGKQFSLWQERGHAKAFETLATDLSKQVAAKAGVKGDPQQAKECLVCHVTAYNAPAAQKEATLTMEEGVSCEACHGPGSEYKNMKVMKDIYAGTAKGADFGLIEPTKELCVTCHNPKSPTYKEFIFEEAVKKIAHPVVALEEETK